MLPSHGDPCAYNVRGGFGEGSPAARFPKSPRLTTPRLQHESPGPGAHNVGSTARGTPRSTGALLVGLPASRATETGRGPGAYDWAAAHSATTIGGPRAPSATFRGRIPERVENPTANASVGDVTAAEASRRPSPPGVRFGGPGQEFPAERNMSHVTGPAGPGPTKYETDVSQSGPAASFKGKADRQWCIRRTVAPSAQAYTLPSFTDTMGRHTMGMHPEERRCSGRMPFANLRGEPGGESPRFSMPRSARFARSSKSVDTAVDTAMGQTTRREQKGGGTFGRAKMPCLQSANRDEGFDKGPGPGHYSVAPGEVKALAFKKSARFTTAAEPDHDGPLDPRKPGERAKGAVAYSKEHKVMVGPRDQRRPLHQDCEKGHGGKCQRAHVAPGPGDYDTPTEPGTRGGARSTSDGDRAAALCTGYIYATAKLAEHYGAPGPGSYTPGGVDARLEVPAARMLGRGPRSMTATECMLYEQAIVSPA
mmetsp:Transcript_19697/g.47800  ORF Transcript_19697/g.47800 Transcript_19697/m.47800 type:complete len:480 (+) Transcript_19697:33-1472(+)